MSQSSIAIVGSGVAASTIAWQLVQKGHDVVIFEKGPEYPYPHTRQFKESIHYLYRNPGYKLPPDLQAVSMSGDYRHDLNNERPMLVGGSAAVWSAITPRMAPEDFRTRSLYGFGNDWPIDYNEIEPYYCRAESILGVSGTDADNPFAPARSKPYPLPPFEMSHHDRLLAAILKAQGIVLHTTPQARTRASYDGRPGCENFGACHVCPIGARYSPNHHLHLAVATGLCRVVTNTSVRRVVRDTSGRARALLCQSNNSSNTFEHAAKVIIIAAGAIESVRLLLLSGDSRDADGLGNGGRQVGRHLVFHHLWGGTLQYHEKMFAGRVGPVTGQSYQFRNPPTRGRHGGIKVEFSSHDPGQVDTPDSPRSAAEVLESMWSLPFRRGVILHAESEPDAAKYITLSEECDRFGDPFAHLNYNASEFDHRTYEFAGEVLDRFHTATDGEVVAFTNESEFNSGSHHMGGCRMGHSVADSVVNSFGKVHGVPNLFVAGSAIFAGCSGAVNPTLTLVALAFRTADLIESHLL